MAKKRKKNRTPENFKVMKLVKEKRKVDRSDIFEEGQLKVYLLPIEKIQMYKNQETIPKWKVLRLVKRWSKGRFRPAVVAKFTKNHGNYKKGDLVMGAGHKRLLAFIMMKETHIPCFIFEVTTLEEVAKIYNDDAQNDREARKNRAEEWPSLVEEGDQQAVEINDLLIKYGFSIANTGANNKTKAIGTIIDIEEEYGIDILEMVLYVLRNAWDGSKDALQATIIKGLAQAINRGSQRGFVIDLHRLVNKIRSECVHPKDIVMRMKQSPHGPALDPDQRAEATFRKIYNMNKKSKKWPD